MAPVAAAIPWKPSVQRLRPHMTVFAVLLASGQLTRHVISMDLVT